jgi:hypothetical protein
MNPDADFWRRLCPGLSIEADAAPPAPAVLTHLGGHIGVLKREGYLNIPNALDPVLVAKLRDGIAALHAAGVPLGYAAVYDEVWQAFQSVRALLAAVLRPAFRALPAFWAWHVVPSDSALGWRPHRDRHKVRTVGPDGTPGSLTVWLALTNSTPLNGCIYLLPMHLDEERVKMRREATPIVEDLQDMRAVPATAGSVLAWNQGVLHWGGRASARAAGPRTSCALEFQRGDLPPLQEPLIDLEHPPSFGERLGLAERQVKQYEHMTG